MPGEIARQVLVQKPQLPPNDARAPGCAHGVLGSPQHGAITMSSARFQDAEPAAMGKHQLPTTEIRFLLLHMLRCQKGLGSEVIAGYFLLLSTRIEGKTQNSDKNILLPPPWCVFEFNRCSKPHPITWFRWKLPHSWRETSLRGVPQPRSEPSPRHASGLGLALPRLDTGTCVSGGVTWTCAGMGPLLCCHEDQSRAPCTEAVNKPKAFHAGTINPKRRRGS